MTRLEFIGLENIEEMKKVFNALAKGEDYFITYTDKEGYKQKKLICRNGRLYIGSNYSISLGIADDKRTFIGVDYLSSDDRIKLSQNKVLETNVF